MAKCVYCGSETELFTGGVPVCVKCSEEREAKSKQPATETQILNVLIDKAVEATAHRNEAVAAFETAIGQFPSGLPYPDGSQRIKNASSELSLARKEMMMAHSRLNDYLARRIIPEDLRRSG